MMYELFLGWLFHTIQLSLIAAGISLAARVAGYFSFVPLVACLISPFVTGAVGSWLGNTQAALLSGVMVAAAVGWGGWRYLHRHLSNIPLMQLLISLGVYQITQSAVALIADDELHIMGTIGIRRSGWILIGVIGFLAFLLAWRFSDWGRIWRGCAGNPSLAKIVGVPIDRYIGVAFSVGSAMCALGALAYATDTGYHTNYAFPIFLRGITAAVIGGLGGPTGLVAGAASVAGLQILTTYNFSGHWADATTFLILISFLILKPFGFSGRRFRKVEV